MHSDGAGAAQGSAPRLADSEAVGGGAGSMSAAGSALAVACVEACRSGDYHALSAILSAGALDVNLPIANSTAGFKAPPLWWAAEAGHADCVRALIARGASTEACSRNRNCFIVHEHARGVPHKIRCRVRSSSGS